MLNQLSHRDSSAGWAESNLHVIYYLSSVTGQFWNVPVHIEHYTGPLKEEDGSIVDRDKLYLITVFPGTGGKQRSFLGEWRSIAWDQKSGGIFVFS